MLTIVLGDPRRLWHTWWDYQVRRAAGAMLRLDAGALADIGVDRRDVESLATTNRRRDGGAGVEGCAVPA